MADCQNCNESGSGRNLVPALAVAALAGVAVTYFVMARRDRTANTPLAVDKVVNLCNSAADKLDAFAARAQAS